MTFGTQAFINYMAQTGSLNQYATDIKVVWASANTNGDLARAAGSGAQFQTAAMRNGQLSYEFNFGETQSKDFRLRQVTLTNRRPYLLHVERMNTYVRLSLDGLSGPYSVQRFGEPWDPAQFVYASSGIYLGLSDAQGAVSFQGRKEEEFH